MRFETSYSSCLIFSLISRTSYQTFAKTVKLHAPLSTWATVVAPGMENASILYFSEISLSDNTLSWMKKWLHDINQMLLIRRLYWLQVKNVTANTLVQYILALDGIHCEGTVSLSSLCKNGRFSPFKGCDDSYIKPFSI